ncbi:hypothetical protein [Agromyces sp. NPDC058126]|uniref:hypothetical protein n=1 Tax=Agromyces sp. NPDC058126 TaxID=3346350 RepID=UPI0036DEAD6A
MENTTQLASEPKAASPWRQYGLIGVVGILIVPGAIVLAFNSWSAPDDAAYVRMAFALVAAYTVAVITALGLVALSLVRRTRRATPMLIALAVIVMTFAVGGLNLAAESLLRVLSN